ncbi:arginine--tRNA ligase [Dyella caseinilytica]|uniref:Arginine--tRNA ligase n=1 Tax=Dyella caseinilytica TaxID=1849581 RepID=A0ABX7GTS8_9GAMM|nr:arginine--tRNA ligase [Dyella caseinilytica]QRN53822.1 arginine--tRNA ligase [Dyella caseinilytica]GFZ89436.1 arginine--tRNA ligase [Dyella caseinilytica]
MFHALSARIDAILCDAFQALNLPIIHARAAPCSRPELADFQCNGAMPAAKAVGRMPRDIAEAVATRLSTHAAFSEVSMAGPGFINMRLAPSLLAEAAAELLGDLRLGIEDVGQGRLVVIDFGGPNVAKPLHVGHLRSLVIGESLRRLLHAQGWRVIADAHLGDWGLQMGMLTSALRLRDPQLPWFISSFEGPWPDTAPVTLSELERLYPEAAAACRNDPERMAQARADTAALQAGDLGLLALWRSLRALSLQAQQRDFASLGAHFDLLLGESDAQSIIPAMIDDLRTRGMAEESDGALVIDVAQPNDRHDVPPLLLSKQDGAALYATTDLATLVPRVKQMQAACVIYVVDQRQALHFEQVFRAAEKAGFKDGVQLEHVGFGTVNGPDGKPYKTRQGGVARLADLLDEAVAKAAERMAQSGHGAGFSEEEKHQLARKVGIAAVKFADLSGDRLSGYIFDPDRLVSFEGRTGPYLQYACVRIQSIQHKAKDHGVPVGLAMPEARTERELLLACLAFPDAVAEAARQRQPGVLAEYAFELAQRFSRFYAECPVLAAERAEQRAARLAICHLTGLLLARSLNLLGIDVPERM